MRPSCIRILRIASCQHGYTLALGDMEIIIPPIFRSVLNSSIIRIQWSEWLWSRTTHFESRNGCVGQCRLIQIVQPINNAHQRHQMEIDLPQ